MRKENEHRVRIILPQDFAKYLYENKDFYGIDLALQAKYERTLYDYQELRVSTVLVYELTVYTGRYDFMDNLYSILFHSHWHLDGSSNFKFNSFTYVPEYSAILPLITHNGIPEWHIEGINSMFSKGMRE